MKHKFPTFYSRHNNKGNAFYISKTQFPFLNLGISSFPHQQSPNLPVFPVFSITLHEPTYLEEVLKGRRLQQAPDNLGPKAMNSTLSTHIKSQALLL